jgi:NAD(P)-dependent dehydrogenase (short-subunit alcohol dehydrogenase family)
MAERRKSSDSASTKKRSATGGGSSSRKRAANASGGTSTRKSGSSAGGKSGGRSGLRSERTRGGSVAPEKRKHPKPPFPPQHQERPGLEAKLDPRPQYEAPSYRAAGKLRDKVALITGGDSGIGRAVAVLYAREGADVAIVYLREEQRDAEETQRAVEAEGRSCLLLPGDVSDPDFCEEAVERTVKELGGLDILVNNAAYQESQQSLEEIANEQWEHTFRVNIFGYFYMARAALAHVRRGSAIVNCGSITGLQGSERLIDYSATKGAIHAFTKSLAQSLVERGIRVNCVSPGPVWTPLNVADKPAKEAGKHGENQPMERPAQPEEIAPAFVFFASEGDSSYITGEILTLLGGETRAG